MNGRARKGVTEGVLITHSLDGTVEGSLDLVEQYALRGRRMKFKFQIYH